MGTPRRLVFGEVAELYDRHRPTYPAGLVEDLAARLLAGSRALEVGAGTGKATALFAARGIALLAVEPSPEMAAIARRACAGFPDAEVVESDFESWAPAGEAFGLLYCAQAWHWIDPARRYALARAALARGAWLAVFWNRPAWDASPVREGLAAVYRRIAPGMSIAGPLHPANPSPGEEPDEDWEAEIAAAGGFTEPERRTYRWSTEYDAAGFTGMLATVSEFRLLDPETRRRLLAAVGDTITEHGGTLQMPMLTRLHLARAD
ncbi:MAG: class I SAM-dependent methyltransferase [Solirubrobacteraceae bacterium]